MAVVGGDPAQVRVAAGAFGTAATVASSAVSTMRGVSLLSWNGEASDAFRTHRRRIDTDLDDHADDLARGRDVLERHADELEQLAAAADEAIARLRDARDRLLRLPPDLSAFGDALRAQRDLNHVIDLRNRLSRRTADNLYGLISPDSTQLSGYRWPPEGWPSGGSWADTPLPPTILDGASFDPQDVEQGGIGDCYVLAAVMALMLRTDGDRILREGIRWDAGREGYWVTLYIDGRPTPVFVDHALYNGAEERGAPGVVSLYEAAYAQYESWATLNGGWSHDVFPVLTGANAYEDRWEQGEAWDPTAAREALVGNGYVVANTRPIETVTVPADKHTPYGSTYPTQVRIVGPHAYAVTAVEEDGDVWLMNPWGAGNSADKGGSFRVSAEVFSEYFRSVSIGEVAK